MNEYLEIAINNFRAANEAGSKSYSVFLERQAEINALLSIAYSLDGIFNLLSENQNIINQGQSAQSNPTKGKE